MCVSFVRIYGSLVCKSRFASGVLEYSLKAIWRIQGLAGNKRTSVVIIHTNGKLK